MSVIIDFQNYNAIYLALSFIVISITLLRVVVADVRAIFAIHKPLYIRVEKACALVMWAAWGAFAIGLTSHHLLGFPQIH